MDAAAADLTVENRFKEALQAYEQGNYPLALDLFQALAKLQPYASEVQLNLGNVHFRMNNADAAEACFRKAIEQDPMEANAYLNLGNLCFKQDRLEEAAGQWEIFKKLNRKHPSVWLNLGLAYDRLGEPARALENYSVYLGLEPTSQDANRLRMRFESTKRLFETAVKAAETYLERRDRKQAMEYLGKALAAYPGTARLYKTYASLLYQEGEYREALVAYRQAYELQPDDPAILINLGVLHEKLGQPIEALWAYHQARTIPSKEQGKVAQRFDSLLARHRASLGEGLPQAQGLLRQGRFLRAERLLNQLSQLSAYLDESDRREVRHWLEKVAEAQDPEEKAARTFFSKASDADANGQFDQALAFYGKFLKLRGKGPQADTARQRIEHIRTVMGAVINSLLDGRPDKAPK